MAITDSEKARARILLSAMFILVGLMIIAGSFIVKHYEGSFENYEAALTIDESPVAMVIAMYPFNVGNIGSTLYYDFRLGGGCCM